MLDHCETQVEEKGRISGLRLSKELKLLAVATQGDKSGDADRIRALLSQFPYEMLPVNRRTKRKTFVKVVGHIWRDRPDLVVLEGTGLAGGLAVLLARLAGKTRYVVSSGDAVGPYIRKFHPVVGLACSVYERILYRYCAGFIGWTPYLVGRALTFGARRAMTAAGWAPFERTPQELREARNCVRSKMGIPPEDIVIGIVGSLSWNAKVGYCYGYELVKALLKTSRNDIHVLIVGDGDGKSILEKLAGSKLGRRIHLVGRVPREQVPDYLAAMDVASLPQSVDQVGSFRYTTKISEYMAVGLPIITGYLPFAYDFLTDYYFWRLPGDSPWGDTYIHALSNWMQGITRGELETRDVGSAHSPSAFDREEQSTRVREFLSELLTDSRYFPTN